MRKLFILLSLFFLPTPVLAATGDVTVHFDGNGNDNTSYKMQDTTITEDGKYLRDVANYYDKKGYIFFGWNTKPDLTGKEYKTYYNVESVLYKPKDFDSNNITLYAHWGPSEGKIVYDANGGTGTMPETYIKTGDVIKLPANTFKKEGYDFAGWEIDGKVYKERDDFSDFDTEINADITKTFTCKADTSMLSKGTYYAQGSTIFYKNNKKYVAACYVSGSGAIEKETGKHYDGHYISIFDWETGEEVANYNPGHIGHCNDMCWDEKTGHFFIEVLAEGCDNKPYQWIYKENGVNRTYSLIEFDENFNLLRWIPLRDSDGIPKRYTAIDKQGDYWYGVRDGYIHKWDSDFNLLEKNEYSFPDENYRFISSRAYSLTTQGCTTDDKWLWGTGFIGGYYNNFITQSALNGSGEHHIFKYNMGNKAVNANRREIEDVSIDPKTKEMYAIATKQKQLTVEKIKIPTTIIKALWEKQTVKTGWYYITPKASPLYRLAALNNTDKLVLKPANNLAGQKYYIRKYADGTYTIGTGNSVGVNKVSTEGTQTKNNFKWKIVEKDGAYNIINITTNKALSYSGKDINEGGANIEWQIKPMVEKYTVTFKDGDGKTIKRESVKKGESATPPKNPKKEGKIFVGWNTDFSNVRKNISVLPIFK